MPCHGRHTTPENRKPQPGRHSLKTLRAWAVYRRACANERAVDVDALQQLGLGGQRPCVTPRPLKLQGVLRRLGPLWPLLLRLLAAAWLWGVYPLLLLWQLARTVGEWRSLRTMEGPLKGDVGLCLSGRMKSLADCLPEERRPRQWLACPWEPAAAPADVDPVSVLSPCRWKDLARCAYLAWTGARIVRRRGLQAPGRPVEPTDVLQTYVGWPWFLTWELLPRMIEPSAGVWYANHYDRWAVLVDCLPVRCRRHLIEHGFVRTTMQLRHRMRRTDEVLYFDEPTRRNLLEVVLAKACRPVCTPIAIRLPLTDWPRPSEKRALLLVIGSPLDPAGERQLLEKLLQTQPDVHILYKPHPVYGRRGAAHVVGLGVELVWGRNTFPAVDVVLSNGSWLGAEYESTGTPVVWYGTLPLSVALEQTAAHLAPAAASPTVHATRAA